MARPVAWDDNGVASFDLIRHHRANESIFLYAFDLIELNGDDLRRDPLEVRKGHAGIYRSQGPPRHPVQRTSRAMARPSSRTLAKWGLEGIVSKRKDSIYRSGRSPDWLKMNNPACAAVTREAEEDRAR